MSKLRLLAATALLGVSALVASPLQAKPLESIGITMGSLGNPYFVALVKGVTTAAHAINPQARVVSSSADYDLNKQFTQIDNFIASGVNVIILNAVDPNAILPAIKRAQKAGIVVVAADVAANGADATVETDNVAAGRISCEALVSDIGGKGNVIIENGPQVSSVTDRVKGCRSVLSQHPEIKLLSSDQDGKGSRDGGLAVMQGYLIRFPEIAGVFCINDPQAIGSSLAVKQTHRQGVIITSVDGAPDIVSALQEPGSVIKASASQDPYTMGKLALQEANNIMNGHRGKAVILMAPKLITKQNVASYTGWTQH